MRPKGLGRAHYTVNQTSHNTCKLRHSINDGQQIVNSMVQLAQQCRQLLASSGVSERAATAADPETDHLGSNNSTTVNVCSLQNTNSTSYLQTINTQCTTHKTTKNHIST